MKDLLDVVSALFEKDIRAKNAASVLVGLLSLVGFYFATKNAAALSDLRAMGAIGLGVSLVIVFLIAFLSTWLVWSTIAAIHQRSVTKSAQKDHETQQQNQQKSHAEKQELAIRRNLESLTQWQRSFLARLIADGRSQIEEFEVGQFAAVWEPHILVLESKGIVVRHRRAGVIELVSTYRDYLQSHLNLGSGQLQ